jgi:hypothetical protein
MTSVASTASMASMTSTASFHQKNYWSWWFDHPLHPNDQYQSLLWNGLSKIQFFTNIWYSLCLRLLRPADVIFLKAGSWNTNVQTSWSH